MTEEPLPVPSLEDILETMRDLESRVHFQGEDDGEEDTPA